jgi:hypothetical protein
MWSKEKRREYQREYDRRRYNEDAEYREKKRKYYEKNKPKIAFYNVEYRKKNIDKIRAYQREYHRKLRSDANDTGREES